MTSRLEADLAYLAYTRLRQMGGCSPALQWLKGHADLRVAWDTCPSGEWMYWLIARLDIDRRTRDLAYSAKWDVMVRYAYRLHNVADSAEAHAQQATAIRSVVSFDMVWKAYQRTYAD